MAQGLTIGQLAEAAGVPATTIRYYEAVGVLPAPGRTAAGYRQYTPPSVGRLRFIRRARSLGLSVGSLRALGAALDGPRRAVRPQLRGLVRAQLSAVQRQMAELQLLHHQLEDVLHRLRSRGRRDRSGGCRCLDAGRAS